LITDSYKQTLLHALLHFSTKDALASSTQFESLYPEAGNRDRSATKCQ
jgi:hypothetical protein